MFVQGNKGWISAFSKEGNVLLEVTQRPGSQLKNRDGNVFVRFWNRPWIFLNHFEAQVERKASSLVLVRWLLVAWEMAIRWEMATFILLRFRWIFSLDHSYSLPSEPSMDSSHTTTLHGKALGGDADRGPEAAASDRRAAALAAATLAWDWRPLEKRFDSKDSLHMNHHWWYTCSMEVKNLVAQKALPEKQCGTLFSEFLEQVNDLNGVNWSRKRIQWWRKFHLERTPGSQGFDVFTTGREAPSHVLSKSSALLQIEIPQKHSGMEDLFQHVFIPWFSMQVCVYWLSNSVVKPCRNCLDSLTNPAEQTKFPAARTMLIEAHAIYMS